MGKGVQHWLEEVHWGAGRFLDYGGRKEYDVMRCYSKIHGLHTWTCKYLAL